MQPTVVSIFICPVRRERMRWVQNVQAIAGAGLEGDRYASNAGSFNRTPEQAGKRQVTLINERFFHRSSYTPVESRRNILVRNVELMWLIGREFQVGAARFRGVKYCDPCDGVTELAGRTVSFKQEFQDCGGLIAEVIESGLITAGDLIIPPAKSISKK